MRIAVISDIHGNIVALEAVLKDIARRGANLTVSLGDLAFKGPAPAECVDRVRGLGMPSVQGNTDVSLAASVGLRDNAHADRDDPAIIPYKEWHTRAMSAGDVSYLAGLPFSHRLETDGQTFLFVHGSPRAIDGFIMPGLPPERWAAELAEAKSDWVVMGHIHRQYDFRFNGTRLVNAGAVGFSLDRDWRAAYAFLNTADGTVTMVRVEYDLEAIVALARQRRFCFSPDWYRAALLEGWWEPIPWGERRKIDQF